MMPAVRAHMVLAALSDHGDVIGSMPAPEGLEQFSGREIDAWVASDHEDETITQNLGAISEVATVTVTDVSKPNAQAAPAQAAAPTPAVEPSEPAPADESAAPAVQSPQPEPATPAPAPAKAAADKSADANKATRTVRVDAERLDALMHSMGELVIHRTAVEALTANLEGEGR